MKLMKAPSGRLFETYSDAEREVLKRLGWTEVEA